MNKNKPLGTIYSTGFDTKMPVALTKQSVKSIHGRDKVICGGCLFGMIKVQREDSRYDMIPHDNCKGLGYRVDKKYGRPVKRVKDVIWRKSKSGVSKNKHGGGVRHTIKAVPK